jgi:CRP-like cAMP-binding protein
MRQVGCICNKEGYRVEKYFPIIQRCPLFEGIAAGDVSALLTCLNAAERGYARNSFIFSEGEKADYVGVVLSGGVHIAQEDFWGNRTIVSHIAPGELFGEAFSCAEVERLPVAAVAAEDTEVLIIDCRRIITTCSSACAFHAGMIKNLLRILARANLALIGKIEHVTRRTTREKLLSYLSRAASAAGGAAFEIPFSRQELADYLAVDRSAMSAELSRMRDEDLIRYNRNRFELL